MLSLTLHAATVGAVWLIAQGVGAPLGIFQAVIVVPPILLIATVPISIGGWGVRETVMAVAFSFLGLAETDGVIVSVLFGAGAFIVGAVRRPGLDLHRPGSASELTLSGVPRVS